MASSWRLVGLLASLLLPGVGRAELPEAAVHPYQAADLAGRGLPGGTRADLVDYWLGPVFLSQDLLARDLLLLTPGELVFTRVRAASVPELNTQTVLLLTGAVTPAPLPRRPTPLPVVLPPELAEWRGLVRLLGWGVPAGIAELTLAPPRTSRHFRHLQASYTLAGRPGEATAAGHELEELLIQLFASLYPGA